MPSVKVIFTKTLLRKLTALEDKRFGTCKGILKVLGQVFIVFKVEYYFLKMFCAYMFPYWRGKHGGIFTDIKPDGYVEYKIWWSRPVFEGAVFDINKNC